MVVFLLSFNTLEVCQILSDLGLNSLVGSVQIQLILNKASVIF